MNYKQLEKLNIGKRALSENENIISALTGGHTSQTLAEDEMISYDLRAGDDVRQYELDASLTIDVSKRILSIMYNIGFENGTILECGSGEGTKLVSLINLAGDKVKWAGGIDISWSRCKTAQIFGDKYTKGTITPSFFMGDIFTLPIKDNAIDIVYTVQGIYGMGGYERELLLELYRVTKNYLILIEPAYELADRDAQKRMAELGYIKGLRYIAEALGYVVERYEWFGIDPNPLNPAAVMVIKKLDLINNKNNRFCNEDFLCDPVSRNSVERIGNVYFCKESLLSYPIVNGIACMTPNNAIITAKMDEKYEMRYKNE